MATVETLVSTKWLNDALAAEKDSTSSSSSSSPSKLRVLDSTWLGIMKEGPDSYRSSHIPGSLHFDLNECRDKSSRLSIALPSPEQFAKYVGDLGIDNDTHVVVYETNPFFKVMAAPRTWWMFRLFGHDKVSVLDGGLPQWQADGYACESGDQPEIDPKDFVAKTEKSEIIKHFDEVLENQKASNFTLIDSRPSEWFDGSMESIWPGLPLGHISKTVNLPYTSLIRAESDRLIEPEEIKRVFASHGIDTDKPIVASCFVGVCACTIALGAYICGKENVAVYDGSWDEFCKKAPSDSYVTVPDPKK